MLSKSITWLKDWFGSFSFGKYPASVDQAPVVVPQMSVAGKALELALIAHRIRNLDELKARAKANKKKQSGFAAERQRLCDRRAEIEAGK